MAGPSTARARLVIVCGLPGAGKTTVAKSVEAAYGAVRFCPDEWMDDLGGDLFDQELRGRVEQLQWRVAQRLLTLGVPVVIEWGTWSRSERDELRDYARAGGVPVELRYLDAPIDELWARLEKREADPELNRRPLTRADLETYASWFERPDAAELALFDPPIA